MHTSTAFHVKLSWRHTITLIISTIWTVIYKSLVPIMRCTCALIAHSSWRMMSKAAWERGFEGKWRQSSVTDWKRMESLPWGTWKDKHTLEHMFLSLLGAHYITDQRHSQYLSTPQLSLPRDSGKQKIHFICCREDAMAAYWICDFLRD